MKKLLITAALASTCIFAGAQDMMSKKGTPILPEAGDWSIGVDATDVIRYFGNLFTKDANNNSSLSSQVDQTLVGLYVKDANTAFRVKLRIGFGSQKWENLVDDNTNNSDIYAKVTDEKKTATTNFALGVGLQKSRGKGRLHGIYGAEVGFGLAGSKDTYTYGNAFSSTNGTPTSTDDWTNLPNNGTAVSGRTTESKDGSTLSVNLDGFIGVEYFFAPKMSLSAEYAWGLMMSSTGEGETTTETQATSGSGETHTAKSGKTSSFGLDVSNIGNNGGSGNIVLHFYF